MRNNNVPPLPLIYIYCETTNYNFPSKSKKIKLETWNLLQITVLFVVFTVKTIQFLLTITPFTLHLS